MHDYSMATSFTTICYMLLHNHITIGHLINLIFRFLLLHVTDVVHEKIRENTTIETKCSNIQRYIFVSDFPASLVLEKSYVRLFIRWNDDHIDVSNSMSLNVSATMKRVKESSYVAGTVSAQQDTAWGFVSALELETGVDTFLEINITHHLANIWTEDSTGSLMDLRLKFDVDCGEPDPESNAFLDAFPFQLVNPAIVECIVPENRSMVDVQPFLVVFADDVDKRERMNRDRLYANPPSSGAKDRAKRSANAGPVFTVCRVMNYSMNFSEVGYKTILAPRLPNIGQCVGSCSLQQIQLFSDIATDHAKVVSSAVTVRGEATGVCCAPTKYEPLFILVINLRLGGLQANSFEKVVVKECGCK